MDIPALITQLIGGAAGGNAAGKMLGDKSLGAPGNTAVGALGGGIVGQIIQHFMSSGGAGGMDIQAILTNLAGGLGGGGVLTAIIGFIKSKMAPKA